MSHSITSRRGRDAPAPAREADRVARRCAGSPRSVRRMSIALPVAAALVAARAPQRRRELAGAPSAGRAARARAARARRSACSASRSSSLAMRQRHLDARRVLVVRPRRRRRRRAARASGRPVPRRGVVLGGRPLVGRRGTVRASSGSTRSSPRASPKTERKTASNAATCAGSETNTARAVQYSRRRVTGRTSVERAREVGRALGRHRARRRRAGAGSAPPASGGRSSSIVSTPKASRVSHRCAPAARGRPRGPPPGPRRT